MRVSSHRHHSAEAQDVWSSSSSEGRRLQIGDTAVETLVQIFAIFKSHTKKPAGKRSQRIVAQRRQKRIALVQSEDGIQVSTAHGIVVSPAKKRPKDLEIVLVHGNEADVEVRDLLSWFRKEWRSRDRPQDICQRNQIP